MNSRSPIERMIDAATGYAPELPARIIPTEQQRATAYSFASNIMANLRHYYPDVVRTKPSTWPTHLRNTLTAEAAMLLAKQAHAGSPDSCAAEALEAVIAAFEEKQRGREQAVLAAELVAEMRRALARVAKAPSP